jgi:hypothetical protein
MNNMKIEKSPNDQEGTYPYDKDFERSLAAALVGKFPETRTEIDEFNRDTFFNKALKALGSLDEKQQPLVDEDIRNQFIEDIKEMKYEDMEALFNNYLGFVERRKAKKAVPAVDAVEENAETEQAA